MKSFRVFDHTLVALYDNYLVWLPAEFLMWAGQRAPPRGRDAPYFFVTPKLRYLRYYAILHIIAICRVNFNKFQNCPKMKKHRIIADILAVAISILFFSGCSGDQGQNVLSDQEKKDGWTLLFDGKTMNGWHLFNRGSIPSAWSVDSGRLVCNPHAKDA